MPDKKFTLGPIFRQYRLARRMNLKKMAEVTSIAQSTLSKIENNIISPGFDKVMKICQALDIEVSDLLNNETASAAENNRPIARLAVTRKNEEATVTTDNYISNFVCSNISKKIMVPMIAQLRLQDGEEARSELIKHPGEEYVYIIKGQVKVVLEHYRPIYLDQGDSIYFDSPMGHLYVNAGADQAVILSVSLSLDGE